MIKNPKSRSRYNLLFSKAKGRFSPIVKNKKTASYFTISLSLLCLSFFGIFAIRPTLTTAISLIKEVGDLKLLNIRLEEKISNIIRAQTEYEAIRKSIPLIYDALPTNSDFTILARGIENKAFATGINLNQFQIDSAPISMPQTANKLDGFNFVLIATGNFASINSFIDEIIDWKRLVTIKSLEISREAGTTSGVLRTTVKGTAYYEP